MSEDRRTAADLPAPDVEATRHLLSLLVAPDKTPAPTIRPSDPPSSRWVTVDEACAHLQVTRRTLERYRTAGRLTAYRLGPAAVRFRLSDLDALFAPIDPEA